MEYRQTGAPGGSSVGVGMVKEEQLVERRVVREACWMEKESAGGGGGLGISV